MQNIFEKIKKHAFEAKQRGEKPEPYYLTITEMAEFERFRSNLTSSFNEKPWRYYGVILLEKPPGIF
jgi:hypothetical protein